jgi:hypothetical protein
LSPTSGGTPSSAASGSRASSGIPPGSAASRTPYPTTARVATQARRTTNSRRTADARTTAHTGSAGDTPKAQPAGARRTTRSGGPTGPTRNPCASPRASVADRRGFRASKGERRGKSGPRERRVAIGRA